jgi:hypothetical protein
MSIDALDLLPDFLTRSRLALDPAAGNLGPEETFCISSELVPGIQQRRSDISCELLADTSLWCELPIYTSHLASPPKASDHVSRLSKFTGRFKSRFLETSGAVVE